MKFVYSIRWTGQQELHHHTRWPIPSPISLYAHIQEGHALVEGSELGFSRRHPRRRLARLLVLLPRRFQALGAAEVAGLALSARFCRGSLADDALAGRLQHILHLDQLSLVVFHVLDKLADGIVGAVDLVVLGGKGFEEEGGEGGAEDERGGEAEDLYDLSACFAVFGMVKQTSACGPMSRNVTERRGVAVDHSKSKKHEGLAVYLAIASKMLKKRRIAVFEHFTHQLVIVLVDELVTVCIRS